MDHQPIKIGLLGIGRMGSYHLQKLMQHSEVELCGVFDKNSERVHQAASEHQIKVFASEDELFFESDAVVVASPTPTHFDIAKKALENDLHVFVEKPICDQVDLASQLVNLASQKNRVLQTGFVERYQWLLLKNQLPPIFNKRPVLISAERNALTPSREAGMDVVMDIMIHDVDLALWLIGEPPVSIQAAGASVNSSVIDIAYARLEFPSGATAHLQANWFAPQRRRETQVVWDNRSLVHDQLEGKAWLSQFDGKEIWEKREIEVKAADPLMLQLDAFIQAIRGSSPVVVSGLEGLRTLEVVEEIKQKIRAKETDKNRVSPREKKFLSRFWGEYAH